MTYPQVRPYFGGNSVIAGRVRIDGRAYVNDAGTFRPVFQSGLYLCVKSPAERAAFMDETRALGFNGFRVFCGHLGQVNQTPEMARAVLPTLLDEAAQRGLYVYVCACTGGGYDVEAHLTAIAQICSEHVNAILEGANEIGHGSQSELVNDVPRFLATCQRVIPASVTWTLGAPVGTDEPTPEGTYPTDGGQFNDAHLDRGRPFWDQVRRVREIRAIADDTDKAAMSGEPIGADEESIPGKREADPTFFWTLGLLCRGFEVGGVFHSEDGLNGRTLRPNQLECARAYVAGGRAIPVADRLQFINAGWTNPPSPVTSYDSDRAVRCYSFVVGNRGWTAVIGITGDPAIVWGNGWAPVGVVAERTARHDGSRIQLVEITR